MKEVMKNVILKGGFDEEFLQKIVDVANETFYDPASNREYHPNVTIFIYSGGGSAEIAQILTEMINHQPNRYRLIAVGVVNSAAFRFFFDANCDKTVLPHTT